MAKFYSSGEVSHHNHAKDLWISMHGGVYDLTEFLTMHPGGEEVLLQLAGQDGTVCFDDIGHSQEAIELRKTLKIGDLKDGVGDSVSTGVKKNTEPTVDDDDWVYEPPEKKSSPYLPIFIGLGVLVYAIIFYYVL